MISSIADDDALANTPRAPDFAAKRLTEQQLSSIYAAISWLAAPLFRQAAHRAGTSAARRASSTVKMEDK
jgi:hypothetical protein